ncbi:MAG TPA: tetratricopeptide repeat protein [Ktedonobacteraceae bacterium]
MLQSTFFHHSEFFPQQEMNNLLLLQTTGLIGRDQEIVTISQLLQNPAMRLLTIAGPGGVGKTRLALQVASLVARDFSDGVRWISLSPLKDPLLVLHAIIQELGIAEDGEEPLLARVQAFLQEKHLLLLLDNFEQITPAALLLTELLLTCPGLKIVVTSREILRIRIEHVFVLHPLALPDLEQRLAVEDLSQYASVALFVQRARAVRPDFYITSANALTVAQICHRLDGLPLAIELAVARLKFLPLAELLIRLEHRLTLLTDGARDLPCRQQTLHNTLTWSYDLLSTEEQLVFRLLAVFVRGCTLESAEFVYATLYQNRIDMLAVITSLMNKSLLHQVERVDTGEIRLTMLEVVREYGQECLVRCNEIETVSRTHAWYYLVLAEKASAEMRTTREAEWLDCLEQEYDDLRTALTWLLSRAQVEEALRFCIALCSFWLTRDHLQEGYQWTNKALRASEKGEVAQALKARVLLVGGMLASAQGEHHYSTACWQESLEVYQQLNDHQGMACVLHKLARNQARYNPSQASLLYQKSLSLARENQDLLTIVDVLLSLADEATALGDFARARTHFEDSVVLARTRGDQRSLAYGLGGLGQIAIREAAYAEANMLLQESLTLYRILKDRVGTAFVLISLGIATLYQGDYKIARALIDKSAITSQAMGSRHKVASYLGLLGEMALGEQRDESLLAHLLLRESLTLIKETKHEESLALKFFTLGCMEYAQSNFLTALHLLEESLVLFTRQDNQVMLAAVLSKLGEVYARQGNYQRAGALMEKSLHLTRELDARWIMVSRLSNLGLVLLNEGNPGRAQVLIEEGVMVAREMHDHRYLADALGIQGLFFLHQGNYLMARTCLDESLSLAKETGDSASTAYRLADLGLLAICQKRFADARPLLEESLSLAMQMNQQWFIASCLERLGAVVAGQHQPVWATQLWAAAAAIRTTITAPISSIECPLYETALANVRIQLGEDLFIASWKAGFSMTDREVLNEQSSPLANEKTLPRSTTVLLVDPLPEVAETDLSQREHEVLRLVAMGLTNPQIAEHLVISPRTVQAHLRSIYQKLAVTSRSGATRYAIEHHLG